MPFHVAHFDIRIAISPNILPGITAAVSAPAQVRKIGENCARRPYASAIYAQRIAIVE